MLSSIHFNATWRMEQNADLLYQAQLLPFNCVTVIMFFRGKDFNGFMGKIQLSDDESTPFAFDIREKTQ